MKSKKLIIILVTILLALFLYSCSKDKTGDQKINNKIVQNNEYVDSTQSQAKKVERSVWRIERLKDEFGDEETGQIAVVGYFDGILNNSVVAGADLELKIRMLVYKNRFMTSFFECGNTSKATLPESEYIKIKLKFANGDKTEVEQFLSHDFMFDGESKLLDIVLMQEMPIKVIVDLGNATKKNSARIDFLKYKDILYRFDIDPKGLKNVLDHLEENSADSIK